MNTIYSFLRGGKISARVVRSGSTPFSMVTSCNHYLRRKNSLNQYKMHNLARETELWKFRRYVGTNSQDAAL